MLIPDLIDGLEPHLRRLLGKLILALLLVLPPQAKAQ